ncbi:PAS domain S-box protein [Aquisediminimonas sediminicola]|uniref:PAS domain S-box protein n=1 Tax=Alteraquisediminimonas sediminicola TaxID=2676787 RepID=UPI001C8DCD4A|nr:PAS domain S-box protein [Aquisediminimonas sediminicola]
MRLRQASGIIALINILLTLVSAFSVLFVIHISHQRRDIAAAMFDSATVAGNLTSLTVDTGTAARAFVATGDAQFEAAFNSARQKIAPAWTSGIKQFAQHELTETERTALDRARRTADQAVAIEAQAITAFKSGDRARATMLLQGRAHDDLSFAAISQISNVHRLIQQRLNTKSASLGNKRDLTIANASLVVGLNLLVVLVTLVGFYRQKLIVPLLTLIEQATRLAKGDRSVEFDYRNEPSELGELARALQGFGVSMYQLDNQRLIHQRSESWYRRIVDFFPDALFVVSSDGVILRANTKAHQLFGYDRGELIGKNIDLLTPPDVRLRHADLRNQFMQRGQNVGLGQMTGDFRGFSKAGVEFPIEQALRIIPAVEDRPASVLVAVRDISQRKQYEQSLADQLSFQQVLLNTIPYPIFLKGLDGRYQGFNQAYLDYFGIKAENLLGKTVLDFELLPLEDRAIYHEANAHILKNGGSFVSKMRIPDAAGELHETIYRLNGFNDSNGRPAGLVGILVDLKVEEAAISHPLSGDISYADLQAQPAHTTPQQESHVDLPATDIPILAAIETCIRSGISGKMDLIQQVAHDTGASRHKVQQLLDTYTGNDPARHLWAYAVGPHNAQIFELIESLPTNIDSESSANS